MTALNRPDIDYTRQYGRPNLLYIDQPPPLSILVLQISATAAFCRIQLTPSRTYHCVSLDKVGGPLLLRCILPAVGCRSREVGDQPWTSIATGDLMDGDGYRSLMLLPLLLLLLLLQLLLPVLFAPGVARPAAAKAAGKSYMGHTLAVAAAEFVRTVSAASANSG
jgi:hypothetical protein